MKNNKSKAKTNVIETLVKEVEATLDAITPSKALTVEQILELPESEQEAQFAILEQSDKIEVESIVKQRRESKVFLRGAEQLGLIIYNNSLAKQMTSTNKLFIHAEQITNSIGKVVKMKIASFNRTFNTSLAKLHKNRTSNVTRLETEKREIEQIAYFDNINETLKAGSDKARFLEMFKDFTKTELLTGLDVYIKTIYANENNVKGNFNMLLVKPKSLPLFKTWLKFKGAKFEVETKEVKKTSKIETVTVESGL